MNKPRSDNLVRATVYSRWFPRAVGCAGAAGYVRSGRRRPRASQDVGANAHGLNAASPKGADDERDGACGNRGFPRRLRGRVSA
jgi:hypothetical protein